MKIQVKVVEETTYELDITPEEYCAVHAHFPNSEEFRDKVLTNGKIADLSRTWLKLTNLEPEKLEEFFEKSIDKKPKV